MTDIAKAVEAAMAKLSPEEREAMARKREIENAKAQVIYAMFVETADRNYIMARQAYFFQFGPDFWWMAEQAIEKYLKAILLLHGHSAASYSHDLPKLLKAIATKTGKVFECPKPFPMVRSSPATIEEAVDRVSVLGRPSARYDEDGFNITTADLYLVDQLAKAFRDHCLKDYAKPASFTFGQSLIAAPPRRRERFAVDEALATKDGDLRDALLRDNGAFDDAVDLGLSSALITISPFSNILDRMRRIPDDWSHEVASWALANLKLDRETMDGLRFPNHDKPDSDGHRDFYMEG